MNPPEKLAIRGERERKVRTAARVTSWRIVGGILTFIISWILTKNISLSLGIFLLREFLAIILFYLHERIWNKITWGKFRLEKVEKNFPRY